jgi:peptide/nickel transport system permease protein
MARFLVRRLVSTVFILWGVTVVIFLMVKLIPGDAARVLLGPQYDPEFYNILARSLGLDKPIYMQYIDWLTKALQGDLGMSIGVRLPVSQILAQKVPNSLILTAGAMVFALVVGFPLGVISGIRKGTIADAASRGLALSGLSMPTYWWALVMIYLVSVRLNLLPGAGMYDVRSPGGVPDLLRHLILPAIVTATPTLAVVARIARSSLLDVLGRPYILAARAKGLSRRLVLLKHGVRNILVPVIAVSALQVGYIFSAALFTEIIFSWPGIGSAIYAAILARDVPVIQGSLLVVSLVFVLANLFADVMQAVLDPRIRRPSR